MSQDILIELKDISKSFGETRVIESMNLYVKENEFITLLGPSGCGKTTLLRIIGGFEKASYGEVVLDGKVIDGVPAHRRPINTVFQKYALFPHMNVYENIAFGLKIKKKSKDEIKEKIEDVLKLVNLEGYEKREVSALSGGQQQRIAIARAIVNEPKVLLLDEPLGALDLKLRRGMQAELKEMQRRLGITFIFVTHDQEEALTMSDTIVVIDKGEIQQIGTPEEIYDKPKNCFVAQFIGASNIMSGKMIESFVVELGDTKFKCMDSGFRPDENVDILVRPEDLKLVEPEKGMIKGSVESVIFKGIYYEMLIKEKARLWKAQSVDIKEKGEIVGIDIKPENIHIMRKNI